MQWIVREKLADESRFHAGSKARQDVDTILVGEGMQPITVQVAPEDIQNEGKLKKVVRHLTASGRWKKALKQVSAGDTLFVQFPTVYFCPGLHRVLEETKGRGIRTACIVHDLVSLREILDESAAGAKRGLLGEEEVKCLQCFDHIIVHNLRMKAWLEEHLGIAPEKMVSLEIFDYLYTGAAAEETEKAGAVTAGKTAESETVGTTATEVAAGMTAGTAAAEAAAGMAAGTVAAEAAAGMAAGKALQAHAAEGKLQTSGDERNTVIVAGNLAREKAGYVYHLPERVHFRLYGVNYAENPQARSHVEYEGAFLPDELPGKLQGGFGLVWDGPDPDTCFGSFMGEYLQYNNPHKTSLYLAAGLPVIIWEKAAMADFVRSQGCGLCVSGLQDISTVLEHLTDQEYDEMKAAAREVSKKLRAGEYTLAAVKACNL